MSIARKPTRDAEGSIIRKTVSRRTSKGRTRQTTVFIARCRYTDVAGKRKEKRKQADTFEAAKVQRRILRAEITRELQQGTTPKTVKTVCEAIDYYESKYVTEAKYSGNQKVSGLREPLEYIRRDLNMFRSEFEGRLLTSITYDDLADRRVRRLNTPVVINYKKKIELSEDERQAVAPSSRRKFRYEWRQKVRPRAVASVNREMERLRRIFNITVKRGWLTVNPFTQGDPLISKAAENERVRILTPDEESRLLKACTGKREHLIAIVMIGLDTFLRKNELLTLHWSDIDLDGRTISVQALNAKTLKPRMVPISQRVRECFLALRAVRDHSDDGVFSMQSVDTAFSNAVAAAKIEDLHFHDLRGTGITRMLRAGVPAPEVMKMSGHTNWKTFMRYVKQDEDRMQQAGSALDKWLNDNAKTTAA